MRTAEQSFLVHDTEPGVPAALLPLLGGTGAAERARLVVTSGPAAGLEVRLGACDATIGRARGNVLVLPDVSVSRRHAVLRREGARFVLVDLESGNGTRVNGRRVRRVPLADGDRIAFGDSAVRFVDPRNATAPPALRGRSAALAATVLAGALAVAIWPMREAPASAASGASGNDDAGTARWADEHRAGPEPARETTSAAPPPAVRATSRARRSVESVGSTEARHAPERRALSAAVRAYLSGDLPEALRVCADPATLRDLQAIESARSEAASRAAAGDTSQAIRALERAESIDRALSGDRSAESVPGKQMRRTLSVLHERAAAGAGDAEDHLPAVAAHLRAAVSYDQENAAARARLDETVASARGIYYRAYVAKDTDPDEARRAFHVAAAALPLDDDLGRKARRWAEQLDRRRR